MTHGMSGGRGRKPSRAYQAWANMKQRCNNPNHPSYADYGGRGITVCERWADFSAFHVDMGDPPPGLSLDRIDNDRGYGPDNCRWATQIEQQHNRRDTAWRRHDNLEPTAKRRRDELAEMQVEIASANRLLRGADYIDRIPR
jgi:hypothetical protein